MNDTLKEHEVFLDKFLVSFQLKATKETNLTKAMKPEHLQCIKEAIEPLDKSSTVCTLMTYVYFKL